MDRRPTVEELLGAVRGLLDEEVSPALDGYLRFQTRVAVHVLGMLEREWRLGPDHDASHAERLAALGVSDDRELAAAIRAGELDDRTDEVLAALRDTARDRLAVVNPGWLETPDLAAAGEPDVPSPGGPSRVPPRRPDPGKDTRL